MNWFDDWALTLAVFLPVVGMVIVLLIPRAEEKAQKSVALLTTMAILTLGGRIERALERRFWKPGTETRPEDQEH